MQTFLEWWWIFWLIHKHSIWYIYWYNRVPYAALVSTIHDAFTFISIFKGQIKACDIDLFKPSSKIYYWQFQGGTSFVDLLCFCSVLCLLCLCARLFICALWSPAGKGLTSWLSFVVSNCEFVTFPLVSWVGCGTWLYWLLIFAPSLTLLPWGKPQKPPAGMQYTILWPISTQVYGQTKFRTQDHFCNR